MGDELQADASEEEKGEEKMNEKREYKDSEIDYWDCREYAEQLSHGDIEEAVENYLDGLYQKDWPETLTVFGHVRMKPLDEEFSDLERLLETLDEEYGDPDGDGPEQTPAMIEAEKAFIEVMRKEYHVWACEQVTTREINVQEWVKANCPHWLNQEEGTP